MEGEKLKMEKLHLGKERGERIHFSQERKEEREAAEELEFKKMLLMIEMMHGNLGSNIEDQIGAGTSVRRN